MKKTNNKSRAFRVVYAFMGWFVRILFGIHVLNPEKEPEEGGYLICSNHIAASDAVIIAYAFKNNQALLMAKKELFKIPIVRGLIKMLGAFPVDRGGSDVGALKKAISMIKEGKCIGIFSQGHRYPDVDPRTTPVKNGAGLIVSRAECDVVPVYVLRKNNRSRLFRKSYLVFGDKIPYATLVAEGDNAAITAKIFDAICSLGEEAVKDERVKL